MERWFWPIMSTRLKETDWCTQHAKGFGYFGRGEMGLVSGTSLKCSGEIIGAVSRRKTKW